MSNIRLVALSGFLLFFLAPGVSADLMKSLLNKAVARAAPVDDDRMLEQHRPLPSPTAPVSGTSQRKRDPHFQLGDVGYRVTKRGVKANFALGSVSATAQFGESGKHRLEFDSPALPRNSTLALSHDGNGTVQVELQFGF